MKLTVNGKPREVQGEATVLAYLTQLGVNPLAVAVEHNGEIVKRKRFGDVSLAEGDALEIVRMVGGG